MEYPQDRLCFGLKPGRCKVNVYVKTMNYDNVICGLATARARGGTTLARGPIGVSSVHEAAEVFGSRGEAEKVLAVESDLERHCHL